MGEVLLISIFLIFALIWSKASSIEIFDLNERGSALIDLPAILTLLESEGQNFTWSILDLQATGDPRGTTILELEQRVANAPHGLILDWKGLNELARELDQIIDGTIVGCRNRDALTQISLQSDLPSTCDIVIESIDSSLWKVFSRDDGILQKLKSGFGDVKLVWPGCSQAMFCLLEYPAISGRKFGAELA